MTRTELSRATIKERSELLDKKTNRIGSPPVTVQNLVSPGRRCHVRQAGKVAVLSHEAAVPFVRVTRQLLLAEPFRHDGWCFRARERRTRTMDQRRDFDGCKGFSDLDVIQWM